MTINRGDIYWADLTPAVGEEKGGISLVLIISNDNSKNTVIIAAITCKPMDEQSPVCLSYDVCGLTYTVLLNHLRTIDKRRLMKQTGFLDDKIMQDVNIALRNSLAL